MEQADDISIQTRGLLRGRSTISLSDFLQHEGIRAMIARSPEWKYSENLCAWVEQRA